MNIPYTVETRPDTGLANGKLGIWLFLASEVMLFGALFSAYALLRTGAPSWPDQSAVTSTRSLNPSLGISAISMGATPSGPASKAIFREA